MPILMRSNTLASTTAPLKQSIPSLSRSRVHVNVNARFGGERSGNVIERPTIDVNKTAGWDSSKDMAMVDSAPQAEAGVGGTNREKGAVGGGGGWRVLLINSEKHEEKRVIKALTRVVPNCDENHAKNCFHTSKQLGLAIITTCLKEHAEFYRQQLYSCGCKTSIEPDVSMA